MGAPARLLVNIDVPDLAAAEAFYVSAFGLTPRRRFGTGAVELVGWEAPVYLLTNRDGSRATDAAPARRDYRRHWTPVHLDVAVDDLDAARARAVAAGADDETGARERPFGRIATLADPWGNGFCLIEFNEQGYDAPELHA